MIRMFRLVIVSAFVWVSLLLGGATQAVAAPAVPAGGASTPKAAAAPFSFSCVWTRGRAWASGGGQISFNAWVRCNQPDMKVSTVALELLRNGAHVVYANDSYCPLRYDGNLWGCTTFTFTMPRGTFTGGRADWCVAADVHWTAGGSSGTSNTYACSTFTV